MKQEKRNKFAIWHKDESLTSNPEFVGTTNREVAKHWQDNYAYNTASLDYKIGTLSDRDGLYVVIEGKYIENQTPVL